MKRKPWGGSGTTPTFCPSTTLEMRAGNPTWSYPSCPGGDVASLLEEAEDHRLRSALLRRGDKMVRSGSIGRAEDILYLLPEEIERGSAHGDLLELVAERKREWERWSRLTPPARIGVVETSIQPEGAGEAPAGEVSVRSSRVEVAASILEMGLCPVFPSPVVRVASELTRDTAGFGEPENCC